MLSCDTRLVLFESLFSLLFPRCQIHIRTQIPSHPFLSVLLLVFRCDQTPYSALNGILLPDSQRIWTGWCDDDTILKETCSIKCCINIPNLRNQLVEFCGEVGEMCVKIASIGFSIWFQTAYSLGIGFYLRNQSRNLRILEPKEDSFCLKWDFQDQHVFQFLGQLNHSEHHVCTLCQMGKVFHSNILENQWVKECIFGLSSSVFCVFRHM